MSKELVAIDYNDFLGDITELKKDIIEETLDFKKLSDREKELISIDNIKELKTTKHVLKNLSDVALDQQQEIVDLNKEVNYYKDILDNRQIVNQERLNEYREKHHCVKGVETKKELVEGLALRYKQKFNKPLPVRQK